MIESSSVSGCLIKERGLCMMYSRKEDGCCCTIDLVF